MKGMEDDAVKVRKVQKPATLQKWGKRLADQFEGKGGGKKRGVICYFINLEWKGVGIKKKREPFWPRLCL